MSLMRSDDRLVKAKPVPSGILEFADLFWSKVDRKDSGCWHFGRNSKYGSFRGYAAHRVAFTLSHGRIPDGFVVAHKCDNPCCVNPGHLEAVTSGKNVRDAHARIIDHEKGCERYNSILTEQQALAVISLNESEGIGRVRIAKRLGLPVNAVKKILEGRTWSHLTGRKYQHSPAIPYTTGSHRRKLASQ